MELASKNIPTQSGKDDTRWKPSKDAQPQDFHPLILVHKIEETTPVNFGRTFPQRFVNETRYTHVHKKLNMAQQNARSELTFACLVLLANNSLRR